MASRTAVVMTNRETKEGRQNNSRLKGVQTKEGKKESLQFISLDELSKLLKVAPTWTGGNVLLNMIARGSHN